LPVKPDGLIDVEQARAAITERTLLVSVMLANNEIGVLQPLEEISAICRTAGAWFHCDAAQGLGTVPFDIRRTDVDLVSISAHKMYGPKGIGALYVREGSPIPIAALTDGGGHERGLRSGTLNVPAIVGFGEAAVLAASELPTESARLLAMRQALHSGLRERCAPVHVNGSLEHRLPANLSIVFPYVESERLMTALQEVLAVSAGAACASATLESSHVLTALGVGRDAARSTIRFGLGRFNRREEVDTAVTAVAQEVNRLRERNPLYRLASQSGLETRDVSPVANR
jgi:cysteine desulfurase